MDSNRPSHFYPNACAVCYVFGDKVKLCKKCRMTSYCSDKHQADHLPEHEEICKAIQQARRSHPQHPQERYICKSIEGWLGSQKTFMLTIMQKLRRRLTAYEREMCLYSVQCYHRCNTNDGLINCPNCASVSCCMDHASKLMAEHNEVCGILRRCFYLDVFNNERVELDYLQQINSRTTFKDMLSFLQNYTIPAKSQNNTMLTSVDLVAIHSEYFTRPLTVLYGLEEIKKKMDSQKKPQQAGKGIRKKKTDTAYYEKKSSRRDIIFKMDYTKESDKKKDQAILDMQSLVIHVIAADKTEIVTRQTWEVLFHFIKSLKDLTIIMIGPELDRETGYSAVKQQMCNMCQDKNLLFECHNVLYEDYAHSPLYKKPDLTVAFNAKLYDYTCGFLQNKEIWDESIKMITNQNCPFIITSYTEFDGGRDVTEISYNLRNTMPDICEDNPYAGLRPYRQPDCKTFSYSNFKMSIYLQFCQQTED